MVRTPNAAAATHGLGPKLTCPWRKRIRANRFEVVNASGSTLRPIATEAKT